MEKEYTTLLRCWYQHYTGKQRKRKHLEMKLVCEECHCVWDASQGYAFNYCPYCGRKIWDIVDKKNEAVPTQ